MLLQTHTSPRVSIFLIKNQTKLHQHHPTGKQTQKVPKSQRKKQTKQYFNFLLKIWNIITIITRSLSINYKIIYFIIKKNHTCARTSSLTVSAATGCLRLRLLNILNLMWRTAATLHWTFTLIWHFARIVVDYLHFITTLYIFFILTVCILIIQFLFVLEITKTTRMKTQNWFLFYLRNQCTFT